MGEPEASVRTLEPPIPKQVFERVVNPLMTLLLRSPLHGLLGGSPVLVTCTGCGSGDRYTTPVGYERIADVLYVTSGTDRVWWRDLHGGAPVSVRLREEDRRGQADILEDDEAVADYVLGFVDRHGVDGARRLAPAIDGEGVPPRETPADGLTDTVVVRIELEDGRRAWPPRRVTVRELPILVTITLYTERMSSMPSCHASCELLAT